MFQLSLVQSSPLKAPISSQRVLLRIGTFSNTFSFNEAFFFIAHIGADTKKRARALKNKWVKCVPGVTQRDVSILCLDLSCWASEMAEKREKNKEQTK